MSVNRRNLLVVLPHPTQYDPPIWDAIVANGMPELKVWYLEDSPRLDSDIGVQPSWSGGTAGAYSCELGIGDRLLTMLNSQTSHPTVVVLPPWRERARAPLQ